MEIAKRVTGKCEQLDLNPVFVGVSIMALVEFRGAKIDLIEKLILLEFYNQCKKAPAYMEGRDRDRDGYIQVVSDQEAVDIFNYCNIKRYSQRGLEFMKMGIREQKKLKTRYGLLTIPEIIETAFPNEVAQYAKFIEEHPDKKKWNIKL